MSEFAASRPLGPTPSQTVGPFYGYALPYPGDSELVPPGAAGSVLLHGVVRDGAGAVVPDAMLELWQPDASGRIVHEVGSLHRDGFTFTGFGRASTDPGGRYAFSTVVPGALREGALPFATVIVFARGLLHHLTTRVYFGDEGALDAAAGAAGAGPGAGAVLAAVPAERRATLLARPDGPGRYRFDIRLQGEGETVFFDFGTDV